MQPVLIQSDIVERHQQLTRHTEPSKSKNNFFQGIRRFFRELNKSLRLGVGSRYRRCRRRDSRLHLMDRADKGSGWTRKHEDQIGASHNENTASGSRLHYSQKLHVKHEKGNSKVDDDTQKKKTPKLIQTFNEKGYKMGQEIGNGSYAKVRVVQRLRDGRIFAAKILDRIGKHSAKFLPRELAAGLKLGHPNITKYWEVIILEQWTIIIMDYAEVGDLLELIQQRGALRNREAKVVFSQLVSAVRYLHHHGFVHRDLKCENILLRKDKGILLTDFGFAREVDTDGGTVSKTYCGSAAYASPELLRGIPYDPICNDIWSLGCILYIMVCEAMPFDESDMKAMITKQLEYSIEVPLDAIGIVNQSCQALIRELLNPEPTERPSLDAVLASNWLMCPVTASSLSDEKKHQTRRSICELLG